jgi:hypothetical protein
VTYESQGDQASADSHLERDGWEAVALSLFAVRYHIESLLSFWAPLSSAAAPYLDLTMSLSAPMGVPSRRG